MTKEEAKQIYINRGFVNGIFDGDKWREAVIVISNGLEQEPCEDVIIEWKKDFKKYINSLSMPRDDYNGIMEYIDELPITQQPSYNPIKTELSGDLIPRQAVITMLNKIENAIDDGDGFQFNEWIYYAKHIPSAEKTAEWIIHKDTIGVTNEILYIFECSRCGKCVTEQSRYCPNCGRHIVAE